MPKQGDLNVIVETPKGSRNKFSFDNKHGISKLSGVLPEGAAFPFEFGFLPSTLGEDGDPLDMVVLMDAPTCVGCLITARAIGVVEAEQTEKGKTERNDRLVSVATHAHLYSELSWRDRTFFRLLQPDSGEGLQAPGSLRAKAGAGSYQRRWGEVSGKREQKKMNQAMDDRK